jgi:ribosomal protein S18 acetylase RimI-like enzyme
VIVERATEATTELAEALARLVPRLSQTSAAPTRGQLEELVADERTWLLVARDPEIVGALTLVLYRIPTGLRGVIEDVVVDAGARGRGIGEALTREAQRVGAEAGVRSIGLTSRADREPANRLYRRLGFERRETNVYVWRPR